MCELRTKLSIGILSWKRPKILEQTLRSYQRNGLLSLSDDITIFFNEISAEDIKVAEKYKIKYLSSDTNIGIQEGIKALVNNAKNEYFLFLENDWLLIENLKKTKEIISNGIELLKQEKIDVLRLRHSKKPGMPCFTIHLYKHKPQEIPEDALVNSIWVCNDPSIYFPEKVIVEKVNKQQFYIFNTLNANYTNNPCLYRTSFYKKLINGVYNRNHELDMSEYAKSKQTNVTNISLEADIIPWWESQDFKIAVSGGLFTHKDYRFKLFHKFRIGKKRIIYFNDTKLFSYSKKTKYDRIYAKRFKGLTRDEERYILETQFERMAGYKLNLDNPQTFNEKIQWLKHNYRDPLMTKCADKVGVRDYVKEKIGEEYLVPIIGIYNSVDEIDFDKLPEKFVAKVNWGSGQNIIVTDKSKLDINDAKQKLKNWMKPESNHYYNFLEWVYKDIEPKIIIEEYIEENSDSPVCDYKFFCYDGKPVYMYIAVDSFNYSIMRINYYDCEFNQLPLVKHYPNTSQPLSKPILWDKMIEISKILSRNFPFVRVDFYINNNELKIGELTFYPGNGTDPFEPREWDYKFGSYLNLE